MLSRLALYTRHAYSASVGSSGHCHHVTQICGNNSRTTIGVSREGMRGHSRTPKGRPLPPLQEQSPRSQASHRSRSIGHCDSILTDLLSHIVIMLQAGQYERGEPPPQGGWPQSVLTYFGGTPEESEYRRYQRPLRIPILQQQAEFWQQRLVEEWVRQIDTIEGRQIELGAGRLSPTGNSTLENINSQKGVEALSRANHKNEQGQFPPPQRSPWPFPQVE